MYYGGTRCILAIPPLIKSALVEQAFAPHLTLSMSSLSKMRSLLFLFVACFRLAFCWSESISATGLLGSHFGTPVFNATFDYVVVGGGTAGLTLAARLAENSSSTVAVIEAGGFSEFENGNLSAVPASCAYWLGTDPALNNPLVDWNLRTQPMKASVDWLRIQHPILTAANRASQGVVYSIRRERRLAEGVRETPSLSIGMAEPLAYPITLMA